MIVVIQILVFYINNSQRIFYSQVSFILLTYYQNYYNNRPSNYQVKVIKKMACSKYQYVKQFQEHRVALPRTYMIVRIDGRGFTKFCNVHKFQKPNDIRAIKLMNTAALEVCQKFKQIFLAYGQSDQYSFALEHNTQLFNRRIDKIQTCIVSLFTSVYVHAWPKMFPQTPLQQIPSFDARIIQYPTLQIVKDYFKWRQVDCHINNLYNTVFWCLIKKGMKNTQVENLLKDTNSGKKNQILFSQFGINYNNIQQVYRRGTIICYKYVQNQEQKQKINTSPKITKQLKSSIKQLKDVCSNTDRILSKLKNSSIKQDIQDFKQLQFLKKQLEGIKSKYEQIDMKNSEKKLKTIKDKKEKSQLKECYDDLIKDQFWEQVRLG